LESVILDARAGHNTGRGRYVSVQGGGGRVYLGDLLLEIVVICQKLGLSVGDLDQTKLVLLLRVFVDKTSGKDGCHLAVDRGDFIEDSGGRVVAPVLGEDNGGIVLFPLRSETGIARGLIVGVTAPSVRVDTVKIDGGVFVVAVELILDIHVGRYIGGGVTYGNGPSLVLEIGLDVTDGCLDKSGGIGGLIPEHDFISSEETEGMIEVHKLVNLLFVGGEEDGVPFRIVKVDAVLAGRQVEHEVDAVVFQHLHSGGMIDRKI